MTDYRALLTTLAVPRLTGTRGNHQVRERLKQELATRGLVVMEHRFTARSLLHHLGRVPLEGVNVIAVRPRTRVTTWLVAHYDSKGQPLSMAWRLVAAALALLGALELLTIVFRAALGTLHLATPDLVAVVVTAGGLLLLAGNRVTDRSAGAVDNATGILAALATLDALPEQASVGVLFPDAEEYGLQGARALVRERANLLTGTCVVNFDGVDDRGSTIVVVHRRGPTVAAVGRELGARRARWLPVLVDGIVLARSAREGVTIMRGDWSTVRLVHTPRDVAERLTLDGVRDVARGVAAALLPG